MIRQLKCTDSAIVLPLVVAALLLASEPIVAADPYQGLHSFNGLDGDFPVGQLLPVGSELWGTTISGGGNGVKGVLFSINPDGSNYQIRHGFTGSGGESVRPSQGVVQIGSRVFGMTAGELSPAFIPATLYSINTEGSDYQTIHTFPTFGDYLPVAVTSVGSRLFGVETLDSASASKVFSINADGSDFQYVHTLDPSTEGKTTVGRMLALGTTLYGTTRSGGAENSGTIFSMNSDGSDFQVLHAFPNSPTYGNPWGGVTLVGSTLYGTTVGNGLNDGSVFSMSLDGSNFQTIHTFDGITSGWPIGELIASNSTLYGTTFHGNGLSGSVFSIGIDGANFKVLSNMAAPTSPREPASALTLLGSTLYGTTTGFSSNNSLPDRFGTVFAVAVPEPSAFVLGLTAAGLLAAGRFVRRKR